MSKIKLKLTKSKPYVYYLKNSTISYRRIIKKYGASPLAKVPKDNQ